MPAKGSHKARSPAEEEPEVELAPLVLSPQIQIAFDDDPELRTATLTVPPLVVYQTANIVLAGGPVSTQVMWILNPTAGGGQGQGTVMTDGNGNATISIVPQVVGQATILVAKMPTAAVVATATAPISGH